jgi:protein O-GlcNAc transferase
MTSNQTRLALAFNLFQQKKFSEAESLFRSILSENPKNYDAAHYFGLLKAVTGEFKEASRLIRLSLNQKHTFVAYCENYVTILFQAGAYQDAIATCTETITSNGTTDTLQYVLGCSLSKQGKHAESIEAFDELLARCPNNAFAYNDKGVALSEIGRHEEALVSLSTALQLSPTFGDAWLNKGNALGKLNRYSEAIDSFTAAARLNQNLFFAHLGLGNVYRNLKRYDEALAAYDKALSIKPDLADAWLGRGNLSFDLKHYDEALAAYDKALSIKPDMADAWLGRGNVFFDLKRHDEACAAYDRALSIKPDLESVEGSRLHAKMYLCDWVQLEEEIGALTNSVRAGKANCEPFRLLSLTDFPDDHLRCAQVWVAAKHPTTAKAVWQDVVYKHDKIRLGYVSADLRRHAMAVLVAELFELHDKQRFSVTAFSLGRDDGSDMRRRLAASFDRFIDCDALSDLDVAHAIADSEIDILVDLNGFTKDGRANIFAYRPAPVQVSYIGYPGTIGASYIDYIVGDKTLFGLGDAAAYSEKLIQLPDSYLPYDSKRVISDRVSTRQEAGLPDGKAVFCCFNNSYKILPNIFHSWMRILRCVEGSVLWLLAEDQTAIANLRREAAVGTIDPDRLVFASRMEPADHLARHSLADLFLDTLPYNAHTTAADALWAGLPVLTQIGRTFAGRVAASLLKAIDLPELITCSPAEYEAVAVELALNKARLQGIREKLARNRLTTPLFDAPLHARHLEAAYEAMYRRYQSGLPPDHIEIESLSR